MDADSTVGSLPQSLFRPVKKRKVLRRRIDSDAEDPQHEPPLSTNEEYPYPHNLCRSDFQENTATGGNRSRRPPRARKGGIEFSASSRLVPENEHRQVAGEPVSEDLEREKIRNMCDRFTGHTGQTVDVDKHMMNYIESEMAKRHHRVPIDLSDPGPAHGNEGGSGGQSRPELPQREPASMGKLHEIDLGQETKLHNIARTEAATRRFADDEGDKEVPAEMVPPAKGKKPSRGRRRRNSEDVERDRLVDEVLRESKLDVYDEPEEDDHSDDQAADDKIAEQFRREFIDAIQSRRRVARTRNTKPAKTEAPRGPKLGGSRSARAAMREMQEKSGQK